MADQAVIVVDSVQDKMAQLKELVQRYVELETAAREEVGHLQPQLEDLVKTIKVMREPYEARQAMLYAQIKPLAEELLKDAKKKSLAFSGANVKYRSSYIKHSWDSDKLLGYAVANPEIKAFDTPKEVEALVTVELKL